MSEKENNIQTNESKGPKKKLFIVIGAIVGVLVIATVLVFTLVCFHEWQDATCTAPITCAKCGATEGEALPHDWKEATCTEPKTCAICGLTEGTPLTEDDFLKDLASGLEARWVLTTANEEANKTDTAKDWESFFDAEYDAISKYADADFEDKTMTKLAKQYVECIVQSKECLPYVGTNKWESKYTNGVYNDRVETLYEINAIRPIPVSEENKESLRGLLTDGEVTKMVRDLLKTVKFKKVEDEYGWKTYQAVVKNSTTVDFEYFSFEVDLIDKDSVTLTTASANVQNWKSGETSRFEFSTDEKFSKMEVEYASWYY